MSFKYSCFISYRSPRKDLGRKFILQFKRTLEDNLDPYLDEEVFIDQERLKIGDKFDPAIAKALCQSACMILIYSPTYRQSTYCLREYKAMKDLEKDRFQTMEKEKNYERGLILPVIFRGKENDLFDDIKTRQYYDFRECSSANISNIGQNKEYARKFEKISEYIYALSQDFKNFEEKSQKDLFSDCNEFKLPEEKTILPLKEYSQQKIPSQT